MQSSEAKRSLVEVTVVGIPVNKKGRKKNASWRINCE
jgi:hypothetical protein